MKKYHIYPTDEEYSHVIQSLIGLKNDLIAQGRYTDAVDDVLCKFLSAKKKTLKIKYITGALDVSSVRLISLLQCQVMNSFLKKKLVQTEK